MLPVSYPSLHESRERRGATNNPSRNWGRPPKWRDDAAKRAAPSQLDRTRRSSLTSTTSWPAPAEDNKVPEELREPLLLHPTHLRRTSRPGAHAQPKPDLRTQAHQSNVGAERLFPSEATVAETSIAHRRNGGCSENRAPAHHWTPRGPPQAGRHPSDSTSSRTAPRCHSTAPAQHRAAAAEAEEEGRSIGCDVRHIV